jgi:hypothetical protein
MAYGGFLEEMKADIADPALESLQVLRAKHKIDKMDDGVPLGGL